MSLPGAAPGARFSTLYPQPARVVESAYVADTTPVYSAPVSWGANRAPFVSVFEGGRTVESAYITGSPGIFVATPTTPVSISGCYSGLSLGTPEAYFTVNNTGNSPIVWEASNTQSWLGLSNYGDTLAPGFDENLNAFLTPAAALLPVGTYTDTITFVGGPDPTTYTSAVTLSVFWCYALDDFESYALGDITSLPNGVGGWTAPGTFMVMNGTYAYDDFEGYPTGTITSLDLGSAWAGLGTFLLVGYYPECFDDFESYPTGTITSLTYSTGTQWNGNGSFGISP